MPTQIQIERPRPRDERLDPALDGPALLYSLKATCPYSGGGFELEQRFE